MSLARFGVRNPVPANLLMAVLLLAGVFSGLTMTKEFFPETNPESATITLPYPGATPEEIEESLVRKVEDAVADLDEVERLRSQVAEGLATVIVEFRDGIRDVERATDEVEKAVDALTDLPDDAERITVSAFEPVLPVIMLSLYGDASESVMKAELRAMRDELETLPGMGDMVSSGVRDDEIRVDVDADALVEHGLALPDVASAITAWMADVPGGTVRTGAGNVNVRALGVRERAREIREIVVRAGADGRSLRLEDVARVREDFVDEQVRMRFATRATGGPSASLTVYKVGDQDAVKIAEMVRAYVAGRRAAAGLTDDGESAANAPRFEPGWWDRVALLSQGGFSTHRLDAYRLGRDCPRPLPSGTRVATSSDLARFIEGRLDLLLRNAAAGAVLVFATLLVFLNWRTAFWVGVGLTTALAGTLLFMKSTGVTLNLLTMFGLIIVLGLLVDDAIVVAENIQARWEGREPALAAAIRGTEQVFWPVVATILTSVVAFLPLTFVKGQIGDLIGALPAVVACALFMSLVESILILPSHMGHSLQERERRTPGPVGRRLQAFETARDRLLMDRIVPAYARLLEIALRYRYLAFSLAIAVLVVSFGMVAGGRLRFEFLASSDSETIIVEVAMPVGTGLERTEETVRKLEAAARAQEETQSVSTLLGVVAAVDDTSGVTNAGQGTHLGQIFVELVPVESRDRESSAVIASIRDAAGELPGAESVSFAEIQGGPAGADITYQVSGEDPEAIASAVEAIKARLAEVEGVVDIADDDASGQPELQIELEPGAAALGLTVADVARQVRGALYGIDAHVFSERREDIDVRVRLDERTRRDLVEVEALWIRTPTGDHVPLGEVARLVRGESYNAITRVDRRRAVSVTADTVPGVSPEEVVPSLAGFLAELQRENPSIRVELEGRQRQMRKAFESLPIGFLAAMLMIYVILAWLFASYVQPLAVMLAVPFAIVGVVWGHLLLGYTMTFLSLIGFVALSGIVVNDSLILVQFYNRRREAGLSVHDALIEAGRRRFRPIMLTTITTVLGLTPLMLEQSFQAKFLIPMAISISFGLLSATVLILILLPSLILMIDDARRLLVRVGLAPPPEPAAPRIETA